MKVNINTLKEEIVYQGFLTIKKAKISVFSEREEENQIIDREMIAKQEAAAILLVNRDSREFIFTKQFRYPVMKHHQGFILEIPAGIVEDGEEPLHTAKREILEETGFSVDQLEFISATYVSPGYSTERTHLYYAEVNNSDLVEKGGGIEEETEELEIITKPVSEIDQLLNQISDAKSLLALQWYKISKL